MDLGGWGTHGRCRGARGHWRKTALTAALLLLAGCSRDASDKEPVVAVQAVPVARTTIEQIVSAEAVLYPIKQAALTPKINAPVRKFFVNRGSHVHKGQLLAVLENRDLSAAEIENKGAYEQAQANYQAATTAQIPEEMRKAELEVEQDKQALEAQQKLYDSRENLYRQGALPRKELDQAGVALTQARNQYQLAQQHLAALQKVGKQDRLRAAAGELTAAKGKYLNSAAQLGYSEIRSPIDGVVADRPLYPGEMASAGNPLLTVMDISQVVARAHIPAEQAALLKAGDAATINAPGLPGEVSGKVTLVSPAVDPNSTTIEIWVQAANPGEHLRPGTTVRVAIVAQRVPGAMVVPSAALLTGTNGKTSVMIVGSDGRAHEQSVQTGIRQDGEVQIIAGLTAGQRVITTGAYGLPDGTKVTVENPSAQPAPASRPGGKQED